MCGVDGGVASAGGASCGGGGGGSLLTESCMCPWPWLFFR